MEVELESAIDFSRLEYVFVIDAASGDNTGTTGDEGGPDG
jgi:hypothetical protein